MPDSFTVREPTLDDVFLSLTGHKAESWGDDEPGGGSPPDGDGSPDGSPQADPNRSLAQEASR